MHSGSTKDITVILEDVPLPKKENRIVFAHYKNILGETVYKFYGMYEVDFKKTNEYKQIFKRITPELDLNKIGS